MGMAVDEPRHGAESARVELVDLPRERREVAHSPDGGDHSVLAQDVRVFDEVDPCQVGTAERRTASGRGGELAEVSNQQATSAAGEKGISSVPAAFVNGGKVNATKADVVNAVTSAS